MSRNGWKFEDTTKRIALQHNIQISECKRIFDSFVDEFIATFKNGDKINIPRFGTIYQDKSGYHFAPSNSLMKGIKGYDD